VEQVGTYVTNVGNKGSASDGLACANNGLLYLSMLEENAIAAFDDVKKTISVVVKNDSAMVWPARIGFDHRGNLLFVTNKMHWFVQNMIVWSNVSANFRIWSVDIGAGSYLDPIVDPSGVSGLDLLTSYGLICGAALLAVFAGCFVAYLQRRKPKNKGITDAGLPYEEVNEETGSVQ